MLARSPARTHHLQSLPFPCCPILCSISYLFEWDNGTDLTLAGHGTIDGQGYKWWWQFLLNKIPGDRKRPGLVYMTSGTGLNVANITLRNSPIMHMHFDNITGEQFSESEKSRPEKKLRAYRRRRRTPVGPSPPSHIPTTRSHHRPATSTITLPPLLDHMREGVHIDSVTIWTDWRRQAKLAGLHERLGLVIPEDGWFGFRRHTDNDGSDNTSAAASAAAASSSPDPTQPTSPDDEDPPFMQLAPSELAGIQKWAEEETAAGAIPMLPFNTDGIDPGAGAKDVFIKNLTAENFDDVIAVKPCNGDCAGRRRLHAASTPAIILPIPTFPLSLPSLFPQTSTLEPPPTSHHPPSPTTCRLRNVDGLHREHRGRELQDLPRSRTLDRQCQPQGSDQLH